MYFLAARLGLTMDAVGGVATTVWPPTGIALAALLLFGYGLWPGVALAAFLVNLSVGVSFVGALGMSVGNTLEAVIAAYLLRRVGFRPGIERLRDVVGLVVWGALFSTLISATIGVTSGWLTGVISTADYGNAWRSWWVGDMLSDLVLAPALLTWGANPRVGKNLWWLAEAFALAGLITLFSLHIFGYEVGLGLGDFLQPYFLFPLLIWAAIRFGPRGVATATVVVSILAITGTAQGYGPFARESVNESLLFLQTFMALVAVVFLILAALVTECGRAEEELRKTSAELEQRVEARTAELAKANESLRVEMAERERAEQLLEFQRQELTRSNADLEQFSYIVSHDLQEPLRVIKGYLQLLEADYQEPLGSKATHFIASAVSAANRMQGLIKDLLAYSRLHSRAEPFQEVDCEVALDRALSNLEVAVKESGAVITHDPLPTVTGDPTQREQLFQNLVGNAVKFRRATAPRVHVSAQRNGREWEFSVRDDGIGIDKKDLQRVFLMFQRLHTREEYPGSGIGLAFCKKIVERHGGRIWADSELGKGSTFYFTISETRG